MKTREEGAARRSAARLPAFRCREGRGSPFQASSFITGKTGREEEGFVAALTPATCSLKGVSLPFLLEP